MKVKWLGHACFLITSDSGIKIITDPYITTENLNYGEIKEAADIVTVSHEHGDHNNVAAIKGNPKVIRNTTGVIPVITVGSGIPELPRGTKEIMGIRFGATSTYHDNNEGKQRGPNTIFCFEVDGIRVCHLGDLGHQLDDKEAAELGKVDILLTPVGGFYTIDAKVATEVCSKLAPKVVIPMHFRNDKCAYPIASVDEFLQEKRNVSKLNASEVEFKQGKFPASTQIIVLKPAL